MACTSSLFLGACRLLLLSSQRGIRHRTSLSLGLALAVVFAPAVGVARAQEQPTTQEYQRFTDLAQGRPLQQNDQFYVDKTARYLAFRLYSLDPTAGNFNVQLGEITNFVNRCVDQAAGQRPATDGFLQLFSWQMSAYLVRDALQHKDPTVRLHASNILTRFGELGQVGLAPTFMQIVKDAKQTDAVRLNAAIGLSELGRTGKGELAAHYIELVKAGDQNDTIKYHAARGLARLGEAGQVALAPTFLEIIRDAKQTNVVRINAAIGLSELASTREGGLAAYYIVLLKEAKQNDGIKYLGVHGLAKLFDLQATKNNPKEAAEAVVLLIDLLNRPAPQGGDKILPRMR